MCAKINLDVLQALFWSMTYVGIVIYNRKYRISGIPVIAMASNFSWESVALFGDLHTVGQSWIHIVWFSLDAIILISYFSKCSAMYFSKKRIISIIGIEIILLSFIFRVPNGMLLSCFVIDLSMSVEWFIYSFNSKYKANNLCEIICISKLIGDLFAWLYYLSHHDLVKYIGLIVLTLNIGCMSHIMVRKRNGRPFCLKKL